MLRFEECADRSRDVLGDTQDLLWNVSLLLKRLECFAKRLASVPYAIRP